MKKVFAVVLLVALPLSGALAEGDNQAEESKKERVVCRTSTVTGSRLKRQRTCLTQAQWDAVAEQTKQGIDDFSRSAGSNAPQARNPVTGL